MQKIFSTPQVNTDPSWLSLDNLQILTLGQVEEAQKQLLHSMPTPHHHLAPAALNAFLGAKYVRNELLRSLKEKYGSSASGLGAGELAEVLSWEAPGTSSRLTPSQGPSCRIPPETCNTGFLGGDGTLGPDCECRNLDSKRQEDPIQSTCVFKKANMLQDEDR
jgi:hypothetical protein